MNKKLVILFSAILSTLPVIALAAVDPATWISTVLNNFLTIVVWPIFIGVSVLMFIFAGFMFVTANGDPGKIQTAKKAFIWAVVGIVVAIFAFSAVGLINNIIAPTGGGGGGQQCLPNGTGNSPSFCSSNNQCCSGICSNGSCAAPPPAECLPSGTNCTNNRNSCCGTCLADAGLFTAHCVGP